MMPFVTPPVGDEAYQIERALFLTGLSYLDRTPSVTGNQKKWTTSLWVKRHKTGQFDFLLGCNTTSGTFDGITALYFNPNDQLLTYYDTSGASPAIAVTDRVYRDPSAWYHIVWAVDAENTVHRIWVNGEELAANPAGYPPNFAYGMNFAGNLMRIGREAWNQDNRADINLAEYHHVDGQYLTASDFGVIDPQTGSWRARRYMGTHGTNGFYLPFENNASVATLGADSSGNGNDWTPINVAVTHQVADTPTDNFCTWSAIKPTSPPFSISNLNIIAAAAYNSAVGTFAIEEGEQVYFELRWVGYTGTGGFGYLGVMTDAVFSTGVGSNPVGSYGCGNSGNKTENGSATTSHFSWTSTPNSTIYGFGVDRVNNVLKVYRNGVYESGKDIALPATGLLWPWCTPFQPVEILANFGQRDFAHTPPAGFKVLSAKNLPNPLIRNPARHFTSALYTGTGAAQSVTGLRFQPDLIWIKSRGTANDHQLYDSVRGATQRLRSNVTNPEGTLAQGLTSFDAAGFSIGTDVGINTNTDNLVAWCWKAGVTPGFDIVAYTGDGVAGRTVAHGLGDAPAMMIVKCRNIAGYSWAVYHRGVASDPETDALLLDSTGAAFDIALYWNDTAPTSSVFTVGNAGATNEAASRDYIAYLFAEVPGFSRFGSYVGNGSTDGPFAWCGFRPTFVLIKRADAADNWLILDAARNPSNVLGEQLYANFSSSSGSQDRLDFLSNGFKIRNAGSTVNINGGTYVFAAFAEHPFKYANAR